MTDDFRELLDSSFGEGPVPAPAADRLAPARQALRRRRLLSGGGAALGVAAAVTAVALLGGTGGSGNQAVQPAAGPDEKTLTAELVPTGDVCDPAPVPARPTLPDAADGVVPEGLEVDPDSGQLSIPVAPDAAVPADPGVPALPTVPDGGAATDEGSCEIVEGLVGVITSPAETLPSEGTDPAATNTSAPDDTLVRFAGATGDELVALDGVVLVEQSGDVDLQDYAAPGERSAVAKVTAADGTTVYVLARASDYIATYDVAGLWPTIADFMTYATAQYAGGEGLL